MNKKLTALFLIYAFQFVMSCDERCYCSPAKTFEKTFKGFELKAWDTSGFQSEEVTNTVNKNSFGLTVSVQFDFNQISYHQSKFDFSPFGFASAYACSCAMDEYIDVDAIEAIKILVTDTKTQETSDVTANFTTYDHNRELISISGFFEKMVGNQPDLQLDMTAYNDIPDTSIFEVILVLASSNELIEQTQEINFE